MSITRVQGNAVASSGTVTSQAGTLGSGVTSGNLLVASISTGATGNAVTPPTGWTQACFNQPNSPANCETGLWWGIVGSNGLTAGGTSWTFSFNSAHNSYIIIEEWNSTTGWMATPTDATAVGNTAGTATTSTTPTTGTTSTTLEAVELWVASLTYDGAAQTESSITTGWTKDLETTDGSNNHTATMLYKVASSTGTASCQYTIGVAQHWAGAVATFKAALSRTIPATAALLSTNSRTIPATAALQGTFSRTIPATVALLSTNSRTIPATVALTKSRTIPATAALQGTFSRTIPATAALTVTSSRTIPASAALAASAVFYASNVASSIGGLTQSDQMSQTSGGTETSYTVTMPSSGTNSYVELLSQGGTSSGTSSLPAPTGKGWSASIPGYTIPMGSWSFAFTLAKSGTTKTGASLYVRVYRRTMDGTYYLISSSVLTSQTYSTTKTVYTLPSNTATLWQFIAGDTLYMDAFVLSPAAAWASDVFTVYVSNSATLGVYNDGIIICPALVTTPAEIACYTGIPALQTATTLPVRDQSFTLADAIDQRSILTLTGEDTAGTLSYQRGMPVILGDHDQGKLYDGYVNSDKVSKPAAGNSNAQLEHQLTFMDHHYDVDKRANTTNYLNWTAGDMVCDFIQSTLSQEGVTGAYALESDYTPATFGAGTLSGTVATTTTSPFSYAPNTATPPITSNTGDLELTRAGTQFTLTESTTSDFGSGTLTNMTATSNSLKPTTVSAFRLSAQMPNAYGTNVGPVNSGGTNYPAAIMNSVYAQIWSGSKTIGSNDTFNYDIWVSSTSPAFMAGIDFLCNDGTQLTAQIGTPDASSYSLYDQNGLDANPLNDLSGYAKDCWFTRNINLVNSNGIASINLAGKTITSVSVFIAGSATGSYTVYVKNCYLGSASGSPFFSTSATNTNVNPPVITATGGYVASSVTTAVAQAYLPTASYRVSPSQSISGVGLVQDSNITWTASLPSSSSSGSNPAMLMMISYDNVTWLSCTNNQALPGLAAGANVSGVSFYLKEQFQAGSDPTAIPSLLQTNITIHSAANQTTSDVTAAYGNATAWNTGTLSGLTTTSGGQLTTGGNPPGPAWGSGSTSGQTFFPGAGGFSQSASGGVYTINTPNTPSSVEWVSSRFDFAGIIANGTIQCDVWLNLVSGTPASSVYQTSILYRTTAWSDQNNTWGYQVGINMEFADSTRNGLYFGYGSNNANSGNFTQLAYHNMTVNNSTYYTIKVVFYGNHHLIYVNSTLVIDFIDNTYLGTGGVGAYAYSNGNPTTAKWRNFSATTVSSGTWTSPSISLSSLGTCGYNDISWTELNTAGQSGTTSFVAASLDGGTTWQACSNNAQIPQLARGTNVSGKSLLLQVVLYSTSAVATPLIYGLYVRVCGPYGTVTGTRISPALNLSNVGYVASSNCMWNANIPTSTSLTVQTTQDLSTYHTVGSNGAGEALPYWSNQPAATQDLFNTNTSANYSNTNKSGGSVATWTYDTTNSRITASGGSGALYLSTSAGSMTDMDMLVDMDQSDAGGMVWREVDTSNFYELGVYDASSSGGFTNQLRLYKVSSGTRSLLGSASAITFTRSTFHRIRVTMQSGLINVYWDGTCVQSYLDTSPLGSGLCGLRNDGGTSRYYQLWMQPLGTNLSGQTLWTKATLTTSDPAQMPQLFTFVCCVRGPSIATGATISQLHPVTTPFATYYSNEMDSLVQASGDYFWYVDKWKAMHFGPRLARPGAFPVQSVADSAGVYSGYLLYQPQVSVLSSADLFRSEQIITNVTGTVTPPVETKTSDGSTTSWTMGYPLYSAPVITINGNSASVGIQGIDNNKQFYWQPHSASISYDSSLPKLPSGTVLTFTYVGESTVNVVLDNATTQAAQAILEGNSGIVSEIESALRTGTNGMTTAQATTFGNGLLSRYGNNNTIELIGVTRYAGLAPGTVIPVFLSEIMSTWNAQVPIIKLTTTAYQGASGLIYLYSIDASTGPSLNNWTRVFFSGGVM